MERLTEIEQRCLAIVKEHPNSSTTIIGERLFDTLRSRMPQAYARPAGKVLRSLERKELICNRPSKFRASSWRAFFEETLEVSE